MALILVITRSGLSDGGRAVQLLQMIGRYMSTVTSIVSLNVWGLALVLPAWSWAYTVQV